jgi:hypothetical protein
VKPQRHRKYKGPGTLTPAGWKRQNTGGSGEVGPPSHLQAEFFCEVARYHDDNVMEIDYECRCDPGTANSFAAT